MDVTVRARDLPAARAATRRCRRAGPVGGRSAAILVAAVCVAIWVAIGGAVPARAAEPVVVRHAEPSQPATDEAQAPSTATEAERQGPDPSGQPVPDRSQRIIDSTVWVWLVAWLVVAVVLVLRTWRRVPLDPPLLDDQGLPRFSDAADEAPASGDGGDPGRH